jgi:hypothetical protein
VVGTMVGPRRDIPPMIVVPEIAFVTAISGECRAGLTFKTACFPAKLDNRNTEIKDIKVESSLAAAAPVARRQLKRNEKSNASLRYIDSVSIFSICNDVDDDADSEEVDDNGDDDADFTGRGGGV